MTKAYYFKQLAGESPELSFDSSLLEEYTFTHYERGAVISRKREIAEVSFSDDGKTAWLKQLCWCDKEEFQEFCRVIEGKFVGHATYVIMWDDGTWNQYIFNNGEILAKDKR